MQDNSRPAHRQDHGDGINISLECITDLLDLLFRKERPPNFSPGIFHLVPRTSFREGLSVLLDDAVKFPKMRRTLVKMLRDGVCD